MTLAANPTKLAYPGPGGTSFVFPYAVQSSTHLVLHKTDVTTGVITGSALILNTDYTVAGAGGDSVTVTLTADLGAYGLLIQHIVPITQEVSLANEGAFKPKTHEAEFDKLTQIALQLQEEISRSIRYAPNLSTDGELMDQPVEGSILGWVSGKLRNLSGAAVTLAANLLSSALSLGDALITVLQPFTGASAQTLHAWISNRTITPLDFNATGDGSADDTTPISNMLEAFKGVSKSFDGLGKTYKLTAKISKQLAAGVTWELRNFNFTTATIAEPATEAGAIAIWGDLAIGTPWTGTNKLSLENVTFTDNRTAAIGTLDGIQIEKMDQVYLRNVRAKGYSNTGIFMELCRDVCVVNSSGSNNLYAGLRGSNIYQAVVMGGTYNSNGISAPTYGYGIAWSAGDQINGNVNITIRDVTANGNLRKGLDVHAGVHICIVDNKVNDFGSGGIYAMTDVAGDFVKDIIIRGNVVEGGALNSTSCHGIGVGSYGDSGASAESFIIEGNIVKDITTAGSWGIEVEAANGGTSQVEALIIATNVLKNCGSSTSSPVSVRGAGAKRVKHTKICNNILHAAVAKYGIEQANSSLETTIQGNSITIDSGTVTMGIAVTDTGTQSVMIDDNILGGAATYTGTITDPVAAAQWTQKNNRYLNAAIKDIWPGGHCIDFGGAIPSAGDGYYAVGSVRFYTGSAAGAHPGWTCTTAGVTGSGSVWKQIANSQA